MASVGTSSGKQQQSNNAHFMLPNGERVFIPKSMFNYCVFLRDYKKGMLKDTENMLLTNIWRKMGHIMYCIFSENLTIPIQNLCNGRMIVAKQHFTTMAQFFDL